MVRSDKDTTGFRAWSGIWSWPLWLLSQASKPLSARWMPGGEDTPFGPDVQSHLQIYGGWRSLCVKQNTFLGLVSDKQWGCASSCWFVVFCLGALPTLQGWFSLLVMIFSCPYNRQSQFDKGKHSLWMVQVSHCLVSDTSQPLSHLSPVMFSVLLSAVLDDSETSLTLAQQQLTTD